MKMREDGTDDDGVGIKQYMFVPTDDLPSDLDNTLDTTGGPDQSLNVTSQSISTETKEPEKEGKVSIILSPLCQGAASSHSCQAKLIETK